MENFNYIEIDKSIRFGKPIIKGTRISVNDILGMLSNVMSFEEIIEDFPQSNKTMIIQCLLFATRRESI